jgi:hypothetical protein
VSRCLGLSGSDRKFPDLTGRSGTQRARRLRSRTTVATSAPWSSSPPSELRITRVSRCVARGVKARASFSWWWQSLAVDGRSGASRGHAPAIRRPGSRRTGAVQRLSAFQAGPMPSGHGSCECYALLPVAAACRWSLLLLSPLLSTRQGRPSSSRRPKPTAVTTIPATTTATPRIPGHADQKGIFPAVCTRQLMVSRPLTPMIVRPFSIQRSDLR